jgi:hypothetical protein
MSSSLRLAICRLVECPEFRDLLDYINNDIDTWLPVSHTTVTDWVLRQFSSMKENMKSRLHCTNDTNLRNTPLIICQYQYIYSI